MFLHYKCDFCPWHYNRLYKWHNVTVVKLLVKHLLNNQQSKYLAAQKSVWLPADIVVIGEKMSGEVSIACLVAIIALLANTILATSSVSQRHFRSTAHSITEPEVVSV